MGIIELRKEYHNRICEEIIRIRRDPKKGVEYPNFADGSNKSSVGIACGIVERLGYAIKGDPIKEQTVGDLFELATKDFLTKAFELLRHVRPGNWIYSTTQTAISGFDQYEHLAYLERIVARDKALAPALGGDYIVKPDIIVARMPISDAEVNSREKLIGKGDSVARLTPLRAANRKQPFPILHASISCKWTIRSDRSQNTRTEALNLIRNRKGHLPHVVAVTAEPLPTRISALALGTGDLDCVYHFALTELQDTIKRIDNQDQMDMLQVMVDGRRLRDISDLPFDLAV
jgi:hypothetical protein